MQQYELFVTDFAMFPILESLVPILNLDYSSKKCLKAYHHVLSGKVETDAYMTKSLTYHGSFLIMEFDNLESCFIIICCPDHLVCKVKDIIVEEYNTSCLFYGMDEINSLDILNKFESKDSVLSKMVERYNLIL